VDAFALSARSKVLMSKKATRPGGLSRINFDQELVKIKDLNEIVSIRTHTNVIATYTINTLEIKIRL